MWEYNIKNEMHKRHNKQIVIIVIMSGPFKKNIFESGISLFVDFNIEDERK